jgi:hypothetical protein
MDIRKGVYLLDLAESDLLFALSYSLIGSTLGPVKRLISVFSVFIFFFQSDSLYLRPLCDGSFIIRTYCQSNAYFVMHQVFHVAQTIDSMSSCGWLQGVFCFSFSFFKVTVCT